MEHLSDDETILFSAGDDLEDPLLANFSSTVNRRTASIWNARSIKVYLIGAAVVFGIGLISIIFVIQRNKNGSEQIAAESFAVGYKCPGSDCTKRYKHAAVASDAAICSTIGKDILQQGGSAIDAAIFTLLCDGVANAHSTGIGGGFVMTFYKRDEKKTYALMAREEAPLKASKDMYVNKSSTFGGFAIGIPGEIKGYAKMHESFGKLQWRKLFEPVIKMCEDGFPIAGALARGIQSSEDRIRENEELRRVFTNQETGELLGEGDICKRPKLAKTLRVIAENGPESVYYGSLANSIVADIKDRGGIITLDDLKTYTAKWIEPVSMPVNGGYHLSSVGAPASGSVLAFIINVLNGYELSAVDDEADLKSTKSHRVLTYHRIVEAFKFAYAKRSALGDPHFVDVAELVRNLTDPAYGEYIRQQITDDRTHPTGYYHPSFEWPNEHGTAHNSILAANGDAVSVTSTINRVFGSKVMGSRTGIIFNNQMDDFSTPNKTNSFGLPPSPSNFIAPGKRPMSSMCPTIITDKHGNVRLVVGASGGSKITTSVAFTTVGHIWLDRSIARAIEIPRMHHQLIPTELQLEPEFSKVLASGLHELGHNLTEYSRTSSVVQAIACPGDGWIHAHSDSRKGGEPDGY